MNTNASIIKEDKLVYTALRDEFILIEGLRRNMYLYMYTLFATIYGLGLQSEHHLLLLTFAILIPLQSKINFYSWSIAKLSAYIIVFFEDSQEGFHWSSLQTYPKLLRITDRKNNILYGLGSHTSSAMLGIIATITFIIRSVKNFSKLDNIISIILNIFLILFSIILATTSCLLSKQATEQSRNKAIKIISQYKAELEAGKTPKELR